jgi:2-polyprenyl-6-methoxyphenol hydroxylase-like FAD-dependent oxidoreductase
LSVNGGALNPRDADVVIVGGGPVGLTLAIDLAGRGVEVTLIEARPFRAPPSVKCNHVASRTMEHYRRLGIVGDVRHAGLPADYPNDVAFRTRMTGIELARIPIPARADRYTAKDGPDTWWPTPEPPHRINQLYFEPILQATNSDGQGHTLLDASWARRPIRRTATRSVEH